MAVLMRRLIKPLVILVGAALLLAVAISIQVIFFRPFSIPIFFEKVFIEFALDRPELLTSLRILEQFGIESHNARLSDASPAFAEEDAVTTRQALADLRAYDRAELKPDEQLSYDILEHFLGIQVEGERFKYHNYPVNQLFGVQSDLPVFMATKHQINDVQGAEHYIQRLSGFDDKFSQVLEGLMLRETRKIIPPRFVVQKVLAEMQEFVATPVKENILYTSFVERLETVASIESDQRETLTRQVDEQIRDTVYPAYQELITYFSGLQNLADNNNGVWALPDGEAYYAWAVRENTSTDLTPEAIHQLGLDEVRRIEAEMDSLLVALGYPSGSVGARMAALGQESRSLYPDTDAAREQVLQDYEAIIADADAAVTPYFDLRPMIGVEVKAVPEFRAATAPAAYYNTPAMDGSRPGYLYVNVHDLGNTKKWAMNTLAYHEAIPGHHFQMTIAQELQDVPTFRNVLPFTAYTEGWAMYTERLAKEIGLTGDPLVDLGRLQGEMWRGVRLVVDTGMHHKRWTREQAIDYMVEKTGIERDNVIIEIERYLVLPGQALAYKVGMLKILELRQRTQEALGEAFDIREFHNVILANGAMPLFLLERQVEGYIGNKG